MIEPPKSAPRPRLKTSKTTAAYVCVLSSVYSMTNSRLLFLSYTVMKLRVPVQHMRRSWPLHPLQGSLSLPILALSVPHNVSPLPCQGKNVPHPILPIPILIDFFILSVIELTSSPCDSPPPIVKVYVPRLTLTSPLCSRIGLRNKSVRLPRVPASQSSGGVRVTRASNGM